MALSASPSALAEETDSPYRHEAKADTTEIFYLRTNLLSPLTNIGAEYSIDDHWSVAADYYFPWIPRDKSHRNCFQLLEWNIEGRYWFGEDRTYEDRLEGHSAGLSLAAGKQFVQYVATSTNSLLAEPAYKNWTGQVFKYWHTHPKGDNSRGRRYDNGDIMNLSQDITLYAIW